MRQSTSQTNKLLASVSLIAFVSLASTAASAATFDFADIADNVLATELEWQETTFAAGLTVGGITLVASGSNANGAPADAFFDKGDAGLGVCSTVIGCATGGPSGTNTGDDNVSGTEGGETLRLSFLQSVMFTDLLFHDAVHNPIVNGTVNINGTDRTVTAGTLSATDLAALTGTNVWDFKYVGDEFYINTASVSAIPLPAALPLLGGGLGLLGLMGWRRKRKVVTAAA